MRVLKITGGSLLVMFAAALALIAASEGGALHGFDEFSVDRMIRRAIWFAIGAPLFLALGVFVAAGAGRGTAVRNAGFGAFAAIAAAVSAMLAAPSHELSNAVPYLVAAFVLSVAAGILSGGTSTPAEGNRPAT